jgi:hypothetical protein
MKACTCPLASLTTLSLPSCVLGMQAYNSPFNKAKRWLMFDGPLGAGVI